ncbi:hypothetical protein KDE12_08825 [Campylobacter sp. faydin G-105]|uniref:hypothetical protein n=1 Tax=Campylobacter anatolicus TaxID=2829105 RepID=UPI001BA40D69|nr:hypothetical protein [Campylobacter anatolicus]MBR8462936.1 hypothetical protein [Campylobacter anatolicus]
MNEYNALRGGLDKFKNNKDEFGLRYADLVSHVNLLSSGKIDFISGLNILMPDFDKVNSGKMPEINAIKSIKNELLNQKKKR